MNNIKHLVENFRYAIDKAKIAGEFYNDISFKNFPRGCCGDASDLLAEFLLENHIRTCYVCGTYIDTSSGEPQSHAWLFTYNKTIIDITGDQFKYYADFFCYNHPFYVGVEDNFHKLFEFEARDISENLGLNNLGTMCQPRLKALYSKIIKYI